jgi:hypothetical protein
MIGERIIALLLYSFGREEVTISQEEITNRIKLEQATALLQSLLRQGLITEKVFDKTDSLNRLSCGAK